MKFALSPLLAFATASQAALTGYDTHTCDFGVSGITYVYADAPNKSCTEVCIAADGICVVPTYTVADSACVHNALAFFGVLPNVGSPQAPGRARRRPSAAPAARLRLGRS